MNGRGTVLLQGIVPWAQLNTTQHRMAHALHRAGWRCLYLEPRRPGPWFRGREPRSPEVPLIRERLPALPSRVVERLPQGWVLDPVLRAVQARPLWLYLTSGRPRHLRLGEELQRRLAPEWTTLEVWDLPEPAAQEGVAAAVDRVPAAWVVDRAMDTTSRGLPEVPNAAEPSSPEAPVPTVDASRATLGFCGSINPWLDLEMLLAAAGLDGCRLEVIGTPFGLSPQARALWRRLLRQPSVRWLGPLPYAEAMQRMRGWTLGLLPRNGSPGAQESCPLKVLEYFAAGLPCVTSHRGAAERYREACLFAEGPQAFAEACRIALETHGQLATRCRARAAAWTWDRRVETIRTLVEGRERADDDAPDVGRVEGRPASGA